MNKKILFTLVLVIFSFAVTAQVVIQWAKDIGTYNNEQPTKICSDKDGNSYLAGDYWETLIICNDTLDTVIQPLSSNMTVNLFISKFDSAGNCVWTKTGISIVPMVSGGAIGPEIKDIKYFDGNIYCVGVFTDTMIFDSDTLFNPTCVSYCTTSFIMSIDGSSGIINWSKCFKGSTSYSAAYTVIPYSNGVFVSGAYKNCLTVDTVNLSSPNSWNYNGYLLKFNNSGICLWEKNVGINHLSEVSDMVFDNDKNLYLVGLYKDTIIFPTDTLSDVLLSWQSATFFAKYDTSGNFIWAKGGRAEMYGLLSSSRLCYGTNGYLYYTGAFSDSVRFGSMTLTHIQNSCCDVIVKIDQSGQFLWAMKTGNRSWGQCDPVSIAANNFGFFLFSGFTDSVSMGSNTLYSNGSSDFLLTQYDFDGNIIFYKPFGGNSQEAPKDINCNGNISYFIGRTMSDYMIDNFYINNVNAGDILIARMKDTTTIVAPYKYIIKKDVIFQLYPNPSNGSITVASESIIKEITIRNFWGEIILSEKPDFNYFKFELTVSGLYFITIFDGKNNSTKKLTVIR